MPTVCWGNWLHNQLSSCKAGKLSIHEGQINKCLVTGVPWLATSHFGLTITAMWESAKTYHYKRCRSALCSKFMTVNSIERTHFTVCKLLHFINKANYDTRFGPCIIVSSAINNCPQPMWSMHIPYPTMHCLRPLEEENANRPDPDMHWLMTL